MKLSSHEFEGGASIWCQKAGDDDTSSGILVPGGPYNYGIAARDERIVVVRGKGKISGTKVKWNADGDDPEVSVTHVPRGKEIIIVVEGPTETVYMCDFGRKIFDEVFSRTVEELEMSVRPYNCLKDAELHTIGALVQKTEAEMLDIDKLGPKSLNQLKELLENLGLRFGMTENDMLLWTIKKGQRTQ